MYGVYIRKKCKTLQAKRIVFIIHLSKGGVIYDRKEKKTKAKKEKKPHGLLFRAVRIVKSFAS